MCDDNEIRAISAVYLALFVSTSLLVVVSCLYYNYQSASIPGITADVAGVDDEIFSNRMKVTSPQLKPACQQLTRELLGYT
jgi:hypothetical protein